MILTWLRAKQSYTYAFAGVLGGGLGALIAEPFVPGSAQDALTLIMRASVSSALTVTVLAAALHIGSEWYQRRSLRPRRVAEMMVFGAFAGALGGAAAQGVFNLDVGSEFFKEIFLRTFAWAVMGALIGVMLSRPIPNFNFGRAAVAGFVGGAVGCVGFLIIAELFSGVPARIVGAAMLGGVVGLAMRLAEGLFHDANIEVIWAPNETTWVGLGGQPVTVGGGEDHIFVRGLPPHVSHIVFQDGRIEHIETASGKRTALQDGSHLRIGGLNLVVHAEK